MKSILSKPDRDRLNQLVLDAERRTGAQIVLAVVRRSDVYAELPWTAFALGASVSGLLVCLADAFSSGWTSSITLLGAVSAILGTGAAFALLTVLVPRFAGFLLPGHRVEVEVRQYAESLFLDRELSATAGRTGILLLASLFERRVVLLPDKGLRTRLTGEAMRELIAAMTPLLAAGEVAQALETGLARLSEALETPTPGTPSGSGLNELPDQIIEEKGA
jgi:putative membrane protein